MKERHSKLHSVAFTPSEFEKIKKVASEFNVSFADVVRECIKRELPRLIDRENKRKQAQENKDK